MSRLMRPRPGRFWIQFAAACTNDESYVYRPVATTLSDRMKDEMRHCGPCGAKPGLDDQLASGDLHGRSILPLAIWMAESRHAHSTARGKAEAIPQGCTLPRRKRAIRAVACHIRPASSDTADQYP